MAPCPVCCLEGGFHDAGKHSEREVPRELLKEPGWVKTAHDALVQQKKAADAELAALLAEVLDLADQEVEARLPEDELVRRREQLKAETNEGA
jgi:hypothetical protein